MEELRFTLDATAEVVDIAGITFVVCTLGTLSFDTDGTGSARVDADFVLDEEFVLALSTLSAVNTPKAFVGTRLTLFAEGEGVVGAVNMAFVVEEE